MRSFMTVRVQVRCDRSDNVRPVVRGSGSWYILERCKTLDLSSIRTYLRTHMRGQSSLGSIHRGVLGLLGDRLGVRPIDKKPPQSPWLRQRKPRCHAAGALHDTPGGLLPFQKVAVRGCESMLIYPLPSKLAASVKRYTPFGQVSLGRHSHISKVRTGLLLWGPPPIITTLPWLAPWPRPVLPTKGKTQCEPVHTIDETDVKGTHLVSQAAPNSRTFSEPIQAARPQVLCSSDFVALNLVVRRQAAPRGLALPGLACEVSSGRRVSPLSGLPACPLATVPRVPRTGSPWID